jgi:hypothetical protein
MVSGIQLTLQALREPLERAGFRKRAGEIFTIVLEEGILGWLGLNYSSRHREPGQVAVGPVVGVRHQAVERLVAELRRERFHEYVPPTVSTRIGYVTPARRDVAWEFGGQYGTEAEADLMAAVVDHGIPFMRSLISLPAILEAINDGLSSYLEYRLPVVLAVMGRHSDARTGVTGAVEKLGERDDAAAQQLRNFAVAFEAKFLPR